MAVGLIIKSQACFTRTNGYHTGMTGKWHLSRTKAVDDHVEHLRWMAHQVDYGSFVPFETYKAQGWSKPRTLKAIRRIKEYAEVEYLGEKQIVLVYQYSCYISSYDMVAVGLHELYKQRSTSEFCDERDQSKQVLNWRAKKQNLYSETWIEQVKGQTMAGSTLTNNFWANDILWQLFQKSNVKWSLLQFY